MSIIFKHIWRNIKSNRFRSVLVILSLALSAAVFYVNLNIGQDVRESSVTVLQGTAKGYDVAIVGNLDAEALALPACEKTLEMEVSAGLCGAHTVMLYCGDCNRLLEESLLVLNDADEDILPLCEGQALMPRVKALYYGIAPGDTFTLTTLSGTMTCTLAAYVESAGAFAADDAAYGEVFVCTSDYEVNVLCAALADESEMDALVERLQNDDNILTVKKLYDNHAVSGRLTGIRQILSIILLLMVAITFFVVSSTTSLIVNCRIPILGTFRSIGATARQTSLALLAESLFCGLIAGVPGVLLGEGIRIIMRTVFFGLRAGSVRLLYILCVPLFTVAMSLAVSLFAVVRVAKIPVKALIFRKQSAADKPSVFWGCLGAVLLAASFVTAALNGQYNFGLLIVELILAVVGAGLCIGPICAFFSRLCSAAASKRAGGPTWLGLRNLGVNRINRSSALLVCVVIALVMMIYICVTSVSGFFAAYENNYPYDILIKFTEAPEENYYYLETLDGVDSVVYEYWDITDGVVNGETLHMEFVAADGWSGGITVDAALTDSLKDGEVILDYLFADIHNYSVGDTMTIILSENTGKTFTATVVGFCESGVFNSSRSTVMMTRNDFYTYVETEPAIIGISTSRDVYDMIAAVNDATSAHDGKLYRVTAKQDYVDDEITEAMSAVKSVAVVPFLTILLALCGLVNNQLISFNQKRMNYAVLYSVAMSRKQLRTMMLTELIASFAVGCGTGLLLSLWLTKIMRDVIFITVAYVPLVITAGQVGLSLLLLLLLLAATAVFPLRRLQKMAIVKEIQYE